MKKNQFLKSVQNCIQEKRALCLNSNALRLINGTADGFTGFTLDQYNEHFQIQIFSETAAESVEWLTNYLLKSKGVKYLIVKERVEKSGKSLENFSGNVCTPNVSSITEVYEGECCFEVDLLDTVNPGLFLDMRENRLRVSQDVRGKKIFNGFSYTCSFGAHCRKNGADWVANVDISKKILARGLHNYKLSGLENMKDFIQADTLEYMQFCSKKNRTFDMIILDPPTFSRFEKKRFHVWKDFPKLFEMSLAILKENGNFLFSTNCSDVSKLKLKNKIRELATLHNKKVKLLWEVNQAVDFSSASEVNSSHLVGYFMEIQTISEK